MAMFQSTPSGGKATRCATRCARSPSRFQSTPSGGKATHSPAPYQLTRRVSIHAFRGEGDSGSGTNDLGQGVSIHAFRGEGDFTRTRYRRCGRFQSTPSGGKATRRRRGSGRGERSFNPRLPGGRRLIASRTCPACQSFNPRLPGGRRPSGALCTTRPIPFQSTPSGGKATSNLRPARRGIGVSIHAFRGEGDNLSRFPCHGTGVFQSTPSGGKATRSIPRAPRHRRVSIHAFRGEGDCKRVAAGD